MRILVFIKAVRDVKIPLEYDHRTSDLRQTGSVLDLNPPDVAALLQAFVIKNEVPETHITAIHLGPEQAERWIRDALSLGCDAGLRIWDKRAEDLKAPAKALIFSRAAELLGFDLIFTGDSSVDTASGQTGILISEHFNIPCVGSVISASVKPDKNTLLLKRMLAKGYEEMVECRAPMVITTQTFGNEPKEISFDSLFEASTRKIPCWDFSEMGLPHTAIKDLNSRLQYSHVTEINPRLIPLAAPDSDLPAFDRVSQLLNATTSKRDGKVMRVDDATAADEIFRLLLENGMLDKKGPV